MNTLYLRLKELADAKNVSLAQVERDLNFSAGLLSKWKDRTANVDKVQRVADYFNVSTDYLLGRENPHQDPVNYYRIDTTGLDPDEIDEIKDALDKYTRFLKSELEKDDDEE